MASDRRQIQSPFSKRLYCNVPHTGVPHCILIIYANRPQMDKYVSNWQTYVSDFKKIIILTSPCVVFFFGLILFLSSFVHSLGVTRDCDAGILPHRLWNYSNEDTVFLLFTALNGDKNKVGVFMNAISHSHSRATTAPSPSPTLWEYCCGIGGGTSWALWEAINECVAWRVVMRGILQPFIRAGRHLTGGQPTGCVII